MFKPPVLAPKKIINKTNSTDNYYKNNEFEEYINTIKNLEFFTDEYVDFYKELIKDLSCNI